MIEELERASALSKRWAVLPDRHEITSADGGAIQVGFRYSEAVSEVRTPAVAPELPEGEEASGPEAAALRAIRL